jgi:hypothetical protein
MNRAIPFGVKCPRCRIGHLELRQYNLLDCNWCGKAYFWDEIALMVIPLGYDIDIIGCVPFHESMFRKRLKRKRGFSVEEFMERKYKLRR